MSAQQNSFLNAGLMVITNHYKETDTQTNSYNLISISADKNLVMTIFSNFI